MHGTHFAGRTLKMNAPEPLFVRDVVTLGANVTRGSSEYNGQQSEGSYADVS